MSQGQSTDKKEFLKQIQEHYDLNKPMTETLRFLIEDQAFDTDFLITAIMEYTQAGIKKRDKQRNKMRMRSNQI